MLSSVFTLFFCFIQISQLYIFVNINTVLSEKVLFNGKLGNSSEDNTTPF